MMLNIIGRRTTGRRRTQRRLQTLARDLSGPTRDGFERKGASVRGWTAGLNLLGAGPYRLVGADHARRGDAPRRPRDPDDRQAGRAARLGRPPRVGDERLRGDRRSGRTRRFKVTRAIVLDPLYPYGSTRWGRSPKPREAITIATLGKQFVAAPAGNVGGRPLRVERRLDERPRREVGDRHALHPDQVRPRPPHRRLSRAGLLGPAVCATVRTMTATIPLILDVDTGIDDSLALLYACASPEVELVAVTCVGGNVDARQVATNTRAVLELAGRTDVEVALGRERPLVKADRDDARDARPAGPRLRGAAAAVAAARATGHAADLIVDARAAGPARSPSSRSGR